ncbi:lipopolysaccharide biosynthesis protein [Acholeplasma granularum]|uniref:lipopolysaccharide biosynthesis protein n=1 Tax=Acholeplasma granularum TaxID=264635 RepID=UPI0004B32F4D|nr:hypothetical protein [Acholeplasma granularum]
MSRLDYSIKNTKYALIGQIISLLVSFITRTVFIQYLGNEYLGVSGILSNIMSIMSLAELGIGASIIYGLYLPLKENDHEKIKSLIKLYKITYRIIAIFILLLGIVLLPFINLIVNVDQSFDNLSFYFMLFVLNTSFSYLLAAKKSLIMADQKKYITTLYKYSFYIILNLVQIFILVTFKDFTLFLVMQILFTLLENYVVSKKANKLYPYLLDSDVDKLSNEETKLIYKNSLAMFGHKLGGIVVGATDNLLITQFIGITLVGVYSNYLLVISAFNVFGSLFFTSVISSIGNLGAEENKEKLLKVFYRLLFINFIYYSISALGLFLLFNEFILLWIGPEFLMNRFTVSIIIIIYFVNGMRKTTLSFRDALGLFWQDRYKPIIESIINLLASLLLVYYIGIDGIFLGTLISLLTTCFWIEPLVLYKYFNVSIINYFKVYFKYVIFLVINASILLFVTMLYQDFSQIWYFIISFITILFIYACSLLIIFRKNDNFLFYYKIIKEKILKIK